MPRWHRNQIPLLLSYYSVHHTCHFPFSEGKHFFFLQKYLKSLDDWFSTNNFEYDRTVGQLDIKSNYMEI